MMDKISTSPPPITAGSLPDRAPSQWPFFLDFFGVSAPRRWKVYRRITNPRRPRFRI